MRDNILIKKKEQSTNKYSIYTGNGLRFKYI